MHSLQKQCAHAKETSDLRSMQMQHSTSSLLKASTLNGRKFEILIAGNLDLTAYCSLQIKAIDPATLKAQGHVTVNKPVISMIYIITHTWP